MLLALLLAHHSFGVSTEVVINVAGGAVALSTRGPSAFRVRFSPDSPQIDTPMVYPDEADADFVKVDGTAGKGISAKIGSIVLTPAGELVLSTATGDVITKSAPLFSQNQNTCSGLVGMDIDGGTRVAYPITVTGPEACCGACSAVAACTTWVYGEPGTLEGNCWLLAGVTGTHAASDRIIGGISSSGSITFSAKADVKLFGRGGAPWDAKQLQPVGAVTAYVDNEVTYAPHYYSTDGYAALGVLDALTGNDKTNVMPVSYTLSLDKRVGDTANCSAVASRTDCGYSGIDQTGCEAKGCCWGPLSTPGPWCFYGAGPAKAGSLAWTYPNSSFEMYLMPADTLDHGTAAYYSLIGAPVVPPRYAFGFIASRWGWDTRAYIEDVLSTFRTGNYPIDAFIVDFSWFTTYSDYGLLPPGRSDYFDFGYNNATFPEPTKQFDSYKKNLHVRMGGIRKPRLGNTELLNEARAKGFLLPGGERRQLSTSGKPNHAQYAEQRNVDFSIAAARDWYAQHQQHYIEEGVSFFWNDEGETDFFTNYWWNVAQKQTLAAVSPNTRFYSLNRAWSPGMARLGANVWTGDINPSWDDLQNTPGMALNWALGGAPYVACDIGGFTSETQADLLTRWYQVGVFMPQMRVHSTDSATPHFPWLWGDTYASAMRSALELRYKLIPYHYSLAHALYTSGKLFVRPLAAEYPMDIQAAELTSEWFDGDILVSPVLSQSSNKQAYLPSGTWYTFNSSSINEGPITITGLAALEEIPAYVRAGTVLPLAPTIQYSDALPGGALEVQVYAGAGGSFTLVEDDGETMDYTDGKIRSTSLQWNDVAETLSWTVSGSFTGGPNLFLKLFVTVFCSSGVRQSSPVDIGTGGTVHVPMTTSIA